MAHQLRDFPLPLPELPPDATVRDAARAMAAAGAHQALVTTPDGEREIVTAADVVQAVADERRLGSVRALTISRPEKEAAVDPGPAARLDAVLELILAVAVVSAARADGVSTIVRTGTTEWVAATSSDLQAVDQLQVDLADGPAFAAMSGPTIERLELRPSASRWPNYHRAALAHGMRRALCVPLVADGGVLGALSLFWRDRGPFAEEAERAAELIAGRAARAIAFTGALEALAAELPAPAPAEDPAPAPRAEDLATDEPRDEVISEAQGILRSRKPYSEEEAFATLRDASERTHRPIPDVAREVVDLPEYMRPKTK